MDLDVEEPSSPEKEKIAMEILEEEARKFIADATDRLEAQGLEIELFKFMD